MGRRKDSQKIANACDRVPFQKALQQKECALNAILNNIPDMAWLKDTQSRFIAVNDAYGRACGRKPESLVGKTDFDIWPRELALYYRKYDRMVMRTRQRTVVEEPVVDWQGDSRWIEVIKTPMLNVSGQVIGMTGVARDVTERRILSEQHRMGEAVMRSALKARESLVRDLHDRTIQSLYALGLRMDNFRHEPRSSRQEADECLARWVKDINAIIRELRSFIAPANPQMDVPFIEALNDVVNRMRKLRPVKIQVRVTSKACERLDARQAGHVLSIIQEALSNSLRHGRPGRIWIGMRCQRKGVAVDVQDDGIGIRADSSAGRGMGLKNIYDRVAEMRGRIRVRAGIRGRGTLISVELPKGQAHES